MPPVMTALSHGDNQKLADRMTGKMINGRIVLNPAQLYQASACPNNSRPLLQRPRTLSYSGSSANRVRVQSCAFYPGRKLLRHKLGRQHRNMRSCLRSASAMPHGGCRSEWCAVERRKWRANICLGDRTQSDLALREPPNLPYWNSRGRRSDSPTPTRPSLPSLDSGPPSACARP
jgi:hypothetical protein